MKASGFSFLFIVSTLFFWTISLHSQSDYELEVIDLKTNEQKINYLQNLMGSDQGIRQSRLKEVTKLYGQDSEELKEIWKEIHARDSINQIKVSYYLKHHGYPAYEELGRIPNITPLIVIHHSRSLDYRIINFEILNNAFNNDLLDEVSFAMYLRRTYKMRFDEEFPKEKFPNATEQIEFITKSLGLN